MTVLSSLAVIVFSSLVVYESGSRFAETSSRLGDYLNLPRSVKGVTFDAISSSLPELMIALFSVIVFKRFEVGIGTIAGSALFNLLIIPALCVMVAPVAFRVGNSVIRRDGVFYAISVLALIIALLYSRVWGLVVPIAFLILYGWYCIIIVRHTKQHQKLAHAPKYTKKIRLTTEIVSFCTNLFIIGIATFFLTEAAIHFSEAVGIPAVLIAFTVVAAATSVPDAVISIANARKGDIVDSAANVFGSNVFDILVGLSLPLLIAYMLTGPVFIAFTNIELVIGLLLATLLVLYFLVDKNELQKKHAIYLLIIYGLFFAYVVYLSIVG